MRAAIVAISLFLGAAAPAAAQISVGIGVNLPSLRIGINVPVYPDLVPVPGYPVYYAPQVDANLFFYDGQYWVYADDNWYTSSWYNGPWDPVEPAYVPYFLLRVPITYYRRPPAFFLGWNRREPPRWGEHWGRDWEQRHGDWDRWNRARVPARAPLPLYQRSYSRDRYPGADEQRALLERNYRYRPREPVGRTRYQGPQRRDQGRAPQPDQQPRRGGPGVGRPQADRGPAPMRRPPIERQPPQAAPQSQQRRMQAPAPRGEQRGQRDESRQRQEPKNRNSPPQQ